MTRAVPLVPFASQVVFCNIIASVSGLIRRDVTLAHAMFISRPLHRRFKLVSPWLLVVAGSSHDEVDPAGEPSLFHASHASCESVQVT